MNPLDTGNASREKLKAQQFPLRPLLDSLPVYMQ